MKLSKLTAMLAGACAMGAVASAQDYSGHTAVLAIAEVITDPLSGEGGRTEFFRQDLGNGQLSHDFVYGDPRNALFDGGIDSVSYANQIDFLSSDVNLTDQVGAMNDAVAVWDDQTCSNMMLSEVASNGKGVVDRFFETGIIFADWTADVTQVGFLSAADFEFFAGNPNVLGVAFTLFWVDGNGDFTDIDENGKFDVAFREIYYNDEFEWGDNSAAGTFDFPTVANHEMGHGFSMAHFGSIGFKDGNLVAKPRAIMNAIYGGQYRDPAGRDVGSHCSNWAQWPNN